MDGGLSIVRLSLYGSGLPPSMRGLGGGGTIMAMLLPLLLFVDWCYTEGKPE